MVECHYMIMPDDLALVLTFCLGAINDFALFGFCVTPGHLSLTKAGNSVMFNWAFEMYYFNLLLPKMSPLNFVVTSLFL